MSSDLSPPYLLPRISVSPMFAALGDAARGAAAAATRAVHDGLAGIGAGDGPVDVLDIRTLAARRRGDTA